MLFKKIKERVVEETSRFYDVVHNKNFSIEITPNHQIEKKIVRKKKRKDTIKWRAKLY